MEKSYRISDACLTLAETAELTGKPVQTVHDWTNNGLKSHKSGRHRLIRLVDLIKFLAAREYQPGSQRERLAKEQADKIAIDNAAKRGQYIHSGQVAEVMSAMAADLARRHDAVPGRVANEFAGTNEPAVIRARLLDELRTVRAAVAAAVDKLADALGAIENGGGDPSPAAEKDGKPVGRRKPRAAAGKRRARAVQKR